MCAETRFNQSLINPVIVRVDTSVYAIALVWVSICTIVYSAVICVMRREWVSTRKEHVPGQTVSLLKPDSTAATTEMDTVELEVEDPINLVE